MKKIISVISILCFLLKITHLSAQDQAPPLKEYQANYMKHYEDALGYKKKTKSTSNIATSMVGWGIGLAIGIAILSGVIPQSKHISNGNNGTGNGNGNGNGNGT